jgi:arabinofuranan 3-O-arabinosyltransferase
VTDGRPTPAGERAAEPVRRRRDPARVAAMGGGLLVLSLVAVLRDSWGRYVGDNRFEQYWAPARRIARSFTTWDGSRGLGRVREDFWPGATAPVAALRALGLPPWLAEHLWHGLLVAAAGFGVVVLLRAVRPRVGWEHLFAGLLYAFGPYSATFLIPSNLFLGYVLAPWLVLCTWQGLHACGAAAGGDGIAGRARWGWAAGFALLVFAGGNTDPPGVLFVGIPVLLTGAFLVGVERVVRPRRALGWAAGTAGLCVAVSAAALAKVWIASDTLAQRLGDTESPQIANLASSWSESWRGLGFWLTYFREDGALSRPQGEVYFSSWWVVLVTFVPPVLALAVVWLDRWRPRLLFAAMSLAALVVMVGAFPVDDPFPFGDAVLDAYERFTLVSAFRGAYKAGAGLTLGVAVLFGVGVAAAARRGGNRARILGVLPVVAALLVVGVGAAPFVSGEVYDPNRQMEDVPPYWTDAMAAIDELPGDGRVLVLPSSTRTRYRWGWTGDDIFDALLVRPHAIDTAVPLSAPEAADLLAAISTRITDDTYTEGSLPAVARRLGIQYVVLRNDLDWRAMDRPRPADLQELRTDPGLRLVQTFGTNGQFTIAADDDSEQADQERQLPPVEVYEVLGAQAGLRVSAPEPPVVVSGDGQAWAQLAELGVLEGTGPVRYTGSLAPAATAAALEAGGQAVITDTNRRRLTIVAGFEADHSRTLAEGEDLDRPTRSLFDPAGSESVVHFTDAATIATGGSERGVTGFVPWNRPANAFDANPDTAWITPRLEEPLGRSVVVDFEQPTEVQTVSLADSRELRPGGQVDVVQVELSDGTVETVSLDALGHGTLELEDPHEVTSVRLRIVAASGNVNDGVGLADVDLGLDLVEQVQVPDDLLRQAEADPDVAAALGDAALTYAFTRSIGDGPVAEESVVRRRFRTPAEREYELAGTIGLEATTDDEEVDALLGGERGAFGSARYAGDLTGHGGLAVDGDPDTAWRPPGTTGEVLTVRQPTEEVRTVRVVGRAGPGLTDPTSVEVRVGGTAVSAPLVVAEGCDPSTDLCDTVGVATFPVPIATDRIEVEVTTINVELEGLISLPMEVSEVVVDEVANPARSLATPFASGCVDLGLTLDGEPLAVAVEARVADLLAGDRVAFTGCEPLALDAGWHELDGGDQVPVSSVALTSTAAPGSPGAQAAATVGGSAVEQPTLAVVARQPTEVDLVVDAPAGAVLSLGESYDDRWRAVVDGEDLGAAQSFDTLSGWVLPPTDGPVDVRLEYRPQRIFEAGVAVSLLGLVACVALVVRARPRRSRP